MASLTKQVGNTIIHPLTPFNSGVNKSHQTTSCRIKRLRFTNIQCVPFAGGRSFTLFYELNNASLFVEIIQTLCIFVQDTAAQ